MIRINIPIMIPTENISNFSDIAQQLNELELNKLAFIKCVRELDNQKTEQLAGSKYSHNNTTDYSRAGTSPYSILTDYGRIPLSLNRIKDKHAIDEKPVYKTVLEDLKAKGDVQVTENLKNNIRDMAVHTTYRRNVEIANLLLGKGFTKDAIWDIVMELGISTSVTYDANPNAYDLIMVDGSGGKQKHAWYAFIGLNSKTGNMIPLHHSVEISLAEIKKELNIKGLLKKKHIIVVDGETGLHTQFRGYRIQMCAFHFEQNLGYALWKAGMSLKERKKINSKVQGILQTLKASVRKNVNSDPVRLDRRIQKTKNQLNGIATDLLEKGYSSCSKFILKHLETLTLFAKEAKNLVKVPWTNNIMERFIGEVAFRVKNTWAHWSQKGLNTIIYLVVNKYCRKNRVALEF